MFVGQVLRCTCIPHTASCVAGIMNEAIRLAGLNNQGFAARSFRPTGATIANESGCDPEITICDKDTGKHAQCFLNITFIQNHLFVCPLTFCFMMKIIFMRCSNFLSSSFC